MLAARYLGPNRFEPMEVPVPTSGPDEALIQVEACGFCGSDLGIVTGTHPRSRPPLTIGHEFCGRIVEIRSASSNLRPGDRVASFPLIWCGECFACRHGHSHVCRRLRLFGFDVDGGMAQFVKLPVHSLNRLPEGTTPKVGAMIEPLAVAVHGACRVPIHDARTAVVIGAGPIGLLTALILRRRGLRNLLISDILASRVALAARLGFTAMDGRTELSAKVMEATDNEGADLLFDCASSPETARQMTTLVRSRGTIVNIGVFKTPPQVDLQAVNFKELTIVGSRVYTRQDFERAIAMSPGLPLESLVTDVFPLMQVTQAFDRFRSAEDVCKVIIDPSEE